MYTIGMESTKAAPARIHVLEPAVAKRIAAGEVIDRPAAALRELLDNALDAGARSIVVELSGGGIDRLRVSDDGSGIEKDDLARSILPHATSKITELDDLLSLSTLGFRGEALSSMAAVAFLEIVSATSDDRAWRLESDPGGRVNLSPSKGSRGTAVCVRDLFASFPARRKFLKRPAAEASACRAVLADKAMAFPGVAFRLSSEEKPVVVLQPSGLVERVLALAAPGQAPELFRELVASGTGFSARLVAGLPDIYRTDRRHIQVFINGRRVQEYGLTQAMEYAYRGSLPGGAWPFVYAFIDVDPEYADFNIHPAKKEVRLKNLDDMRAALIRALRDYLGSQARLAPPVRPDATGGDRLAGTHAGTGLSSSSFAAGTMSNAWPPRQETFSFKLHERPYPPGRDERATWSAMADATAAIRQKSPGSSAASDAPGGKAYPVAEPADGDGQFFVESFRYIGRALGVFLAFELGDELFLLDQHAAHERCLFDQIMAGGSVSQDLLVPVVFEPESDAEDSYIAANAEALGALGFRLVREGTVWVLEAAPAILPEALTGSVFGILRARPDPAELIRATAAQAACKAAVKDGDQLDLLAAKALINAALRLPEPRCPHGRPIWFRLSRDELFRAVRRIV